MKECDCWFETTILVGWDTPEPIRLGRLCKTCLFGGKRSLSQESPCGECQVGNVLHITSFDSIGEFFCFTDQDGKKDEVLLPYDIDNGFVIPFSEPDEIQVDDDVIIDLI